MRANHLERRSKKYAARQYVSETHDHKPDVHERLSADLPINARVAIAVVSDPYSEIGEKIEVFRSIRNDPLADMRSRGVIDDAEFEAGRKWERLHELSTIGPIGAVDPTREAVDGGRMREPITDHQIAAFRELTTAYKELGPFGSTLIFDVLGRGMCSAEAARQRGYVSARDVNYISRRVVECLNTLAIHWGFAQRACK